MVNLAISCPSGLVVVCIKTFTLHCSYCKDGTVSDGFTPQISAQELLYAVKECIDCIFTDQPMIEIMRNNIPQPPWLFYVRDIATYVLVLKIFSEALLLSFALSLCRETH
jgi:hypothetical protein